MAARSSDTRDKHRATAVTHAQNIEYQKSMRNRVLDLILEVVDLPSTPSSEPSQPSPDDVAVFKKGLCLFQPSDFDDLILERNIYDKCGYGLCGRPNVKAAGDAQNRIIWGKRSGPAFQIVSKADLEKWCSKECEQRAQYVRLQLGEEPAWVRERPVEQIKLLDESRQVDMTDALANDMKSLQMSNSNQMPPLAEQPQQRDIGINAQEALANKLQQLALERGDSGSTPTQLETSMDVVEKSSQHYLAQPPRPFQDGAGTVEGHQPRKVRFAMRDESDANEDEDNQMSDDDDAMSL